VLGFQEGVGAPHTSILIIQKDALSSSSGLYKARNKSKCVENS